MARPKQAPPTPPENKDIDMDVSMDALPDFFRPSASYIPPSNGLFMGLPNAEASLEHLLPARDAADRLMVQYFECVHPVARCVHRPTLEAQYLEFWNHIDNNVEPRPSLQAVIFSAMFAGAVSMDATTAVQEFERTQAKTTYEPMKLATETALSQANFLRTTRVETLQAFIMYLVSASLDQAAQTF